MGTLPSSEFCSRRLSEGRTTKHQFPSRAFRLLLVACAASLGAHAAAGEYPQKPIRLIVPSASGDGPDIIMRLIAGELGNSVGKPVVIENRPGAGGVVGVELVARATPDGYTIGYGNSSTLAINRALMKLPYDADRDLQYVVQTTNTCNVLATTLSLPVRTAKDLIDFAGQNPGKLLYGSPGNGTTSHVSGELFQAMTGTRMVHVPYKGSPQAITDLVAGQVHVMLGPVAAISPHVKSGKLRGLAVTCPQRSTALPDLPTVAEAGVPGYEVSIWGGIIVPAATSKSIVARLNAEINRAMTSAAVTERFTTLGYEPAGGTPEQFAALVTKETAKWAEVVKRSGARID